MNKLLRNLASDFLIALIAPLAVLILQVLRVSFFPSASSLDIVAHFSGGSAIALSAMLVWRRWQSRKWVQADAIVRDYVIVMTSLFVGTIWEWWEFWMQHWTGYTFQPSLGDTMQDLFMDTIGGLLIVLIFRLWKKDVPR